MMRIFSLCWVLLISSLSHAAEPARPSGQICWAFGLHDRTVYYASIEDREDRSESFVELLRISGIEFVEHGCAVQPLLTHRILKRELVETWHQAELEVIDTTYLSDLDY